MYILGAFSQSVGGAISGILKDESGSSISGFGKRCRASSALFGEALASREGFILAIAAGCIFVALIVCGFAYLLLRD